MGTDESDEPTIYDVANEAGVAISTVSRVLNDNDDVADSTREAVLDAVRKLQYTRDRAAIYLAKESVMSIGVALPSFTTPFHVTLLKGVRDRLDEEDVDLMICDLDWEDPEKTLRHFLSRGAVEGLILAGGIYSSGQSKALVDEIGTPVVVVGSDVGSRDCFYWDDRSGGRLATSHLINAGHRSIGVVTTPHENRLSEKRISGYRQALEDAEIEFKDELIARGETRKHDGFSEESGYEAMNKLIKFDQSISAVFATSDVQALGAWQAIKEEGCSVPGDYSLVGYDDIKVSKYVGLTSIAQKMHKAGEDATSLLLKRMRESHKVKNPLSKLVTNNIKVRRSTGSR